MVASMWFWGFVVSVGLSGLSAGLFIARTLFVEGDWGSEDSELDFALLFAALVLGLPFGLWSVFRSVRVLRASVRAQSLELASLG